MAVAHVTQRLLDLLRDRRVFLSQDGSPRWRVGDVFAFHSEAAIEPYSQIYAGQTIPGAFGAFSYSHSRLSRSVSVGRYCSFAQNMSWMGGDHPLAWAGTSDVFFDLDAHPATRSFKANRGWDEPVSAFTPNFAPVTIGNDVWIADEVMIAQGVTIGDGAVIGARALVRKDVPPYAVVVGQPARIVKHRFPEPLIERFLAARWWRYPPNVVATLPAGEPERFLDALAERIEQIKPAPMSPICLTAREIAAAVATEDEAAKS